MHGATRNGVSSARLRRHSATPEKAMVGSSNVHSGSYSAASSLPVTK
jgi:hypothetical protein